jgi:iron-sulfur cluster assembly protein
MRYEDDMAVQITENAAQRVKKFLATRGHGVGLRVGIKTTGCSGYSYVVEYADEIQPGDTVFENHGVKVLVDTKSLAVLDGTEVDYRREGLNENFTFNNPNAKNSCGCGESFNV